MKMLACLLLVVSACALDQDPADESQDLSGTTCAKQVNVWLEPTSGMDAITNNNGCWKTVDMVSGADGWGWCAEINGSMTVKHAPANTKSWFFDDTNPVRSVTLDTDQIVACYHAMPDAVPGVEVMARRDGSWQKIVHSINGNWIVNHWIAELHSSYYDVDSNLGAWEADKSIGAPQVNARNEGTSCDSRVYDAVLEVCHAIAPGGYMSVVKNDGRLAYNAGCLTHVTEALNACTR